MSIEGIEAWTVTSSGSREGLIEVDIVIRVAEWADECFYKI